VRKPAACWTRRRLDLILRSNEDEKGDFYLSGSSDQRSFWLVSDPEHNYYELLVFHRTSSGFCCFEIHQYIPADGGYYKEPRYYVARVILSEVTSDKITQTHADKGTICVQGYSIDRGVNPINNREESYLWLDKAVNMVLWGGRFWKTNAPDWFEETHSIKENLFR
jgi:hypothetical protein